MVVKVGEKGSLDGQLSPDGYLTKVVDAPFCSLEPIDAKAT